MPRVGGPWWGVLLAAACNSGFPPVLQSSSVEDDSGVLRDAGTTPIDAGKIDIPASNGAWQADADVTLDGDGAGDLAAIHLQHGVGTITFGGAAASAFYLAGSPIPMGTSGANSGRYLEVVAVQPGRIVLAWVECDASNLTFVYYETTDGIATAAALRASGVCNVVQQPTAEPFAAPATSILVTSVVSGFSVAGPQLSFDGSGPGRADFASATWTAYPFHAIDCTTCMAPGWYELHTLFVDPTSSTACVGILYLWEPAPNGVDLAYLVCLPSVTNPAGAAQLSLDATWTNK